MRASRTRVDRWIPALAATLIVVPLQGCLAAGAAAGAAGAIAYTERGADTRLDATVPEVMATAESVFGEMEIEVTERSAAADDGEAELSGTRGEMEVVVHAERRDDGLTRVLVTAREGLVEYDRDFAEEVLRRLVDAL